MKPLDDPQLRAKLIKASGDMPHVDVWARIQAEAGDISQAAQGRALRPRFTIFSGLQLLAPAFVVLLVFGVTLLSLTEDPRGQLPRATAVPASQSATASLPATAAVMVSHDVSKPAHDRLMAHYAERLEGVPDDQAISPSGGVSDLPNWDLHPVRTTESETRDDMRAELWQYVDQRQPRSRSDALHLIRPFLSPLTPQ